MADKKPTKVNITKSKIASAVKNNINPVTGVNEKIDITTFMDKTWDDVNSLYEEMAVGIITTATSNVELAKASVREDIAKNISSDDKKEISVLISGFEKDIGLLKDHLEKIHDAHKDKTGKMKTEEEVIEGINIIENYRDFSETFSALTLPVGSALAEIVGKSIELNKQEVEPTNV